jgi:beta-glucanase (GH16 family)
MISSISQTGSRQHDRLPVRVMSRIETLFFCLLSVTFATSASARGTKPGARAAAAKASSPGERSAFVPAGYACAWHDEFGGAQGLGQPRANLDEASWTFQELAVNDEAQVYTTKQCLTRGADWNVCVEDGRLRIQARAEAVDCARDGICAPHFGQRFHKTAAYTSGRLMTKHKVHFDGGYVEFRAKLPDAERGGPPEAGLWPAIWMLGDDIDEGPPPGDVKWPACGEIDIMEWASKGGASKQGWNALWLGPGGTNACSAWPQGGNAACGPCPTGGGACVGAVTVGARHQMTGWPGFDHHAWHVYGLLWENAHDDATDRMTYLIDGVKMGVLRLGPEQSAFKRDMFLTINLALGGTLGGPIQIAAWDQAHLDVDYVRWYRKGAGRLDCPP